MRLKTEFLKLPYRFDTEQLISEVNAIGPGEWLPHPTGFKGNSSVPLISVNGARNDDFAGPMQPTSALAQCHYIQQVLATFNSVLGRSRLMRLEGRCEVPEHSDINYHWYTRVRIHIPVVTDPDVRFICNNKEINMQPGEVWIFDTWKLHQVINQNDITRIHLVADTSGSADFWEMVESAEDPFNPETGSDREPVYVPYRPDKKPNIRTEKYNSPEVMSPGELDSLTIDLVDDLCKADIEDQQAVSEYARAVTAFRHDWRQVWQQFGNESTGIQHYNKLLEKVRSRLAAIGSHLWLASNMTDAVNTLEARVLVAALSTASTKQPAINEYGQTSTDPRDTNVPPTNRQQHSQKKIKVGRNDPCPCGSGKKYKRCHG